MAATLKLEVDLSGWYAKSTRVKAALRTFPIIEYRYVGRGWNGAPNARIARAGLANGDNVYPLSAEAGKQMGAILARGLKVMVEGDRLRSQRTVAKGLMTNAGEVGLKAIREWMLQYGAPDGPARTPEWNAYKATTWGSGGKNMVASGRFAKAIRMKVISATGLRRRARRAA